MSPQQYSVEQVADELAQFLNDEMKRNAQPGSPQIGITISGYSAGSNLADEWAVDMTGPDAYNVTQVRKSDECGIRWGGQ